MKRRRKRRRRRGGGGGGEDSFLCFQPVAVVFHDPDGG